ncbi:MAG TPA: hypothetical protein VIH04_06505 [Nitrosarchaeum sp.]
MKNISIQILHSKETIDENIYALDSLYDWLKDSPSGTIEDLQALDNTIGILGKISFQLEAEKIDGF